MRIAYIQGESIKAAVRLPKKTAKQQFDEDVAQLLAERYEHDCIRAEEMFAKEQAELDALKEKLARLRAKKEQLYGKR